MAENYDKNRIDFIRKNKDTIISHYKKTNNLVEINDLLNNLSNTDLISSDLDEIRIVVEKRKKELEQKSLKDVVDDAIKVNPNISNLSVIITPRDINDKDYYGFKSDILYLRANINGKYIMYEINSQFSNEIKSILEDQKNSKLSVEELLQKLNSYVTPLKTRNMDLEDNLDIETIKKEVNDIEDNVVKNVFLNNINDVLEERKKLNNYIKENDLVGELLRYSLNSKGERLYYVGNTIIKFVDSNRNLFVLDTKSDTFNDINAKKDDFNNNSDFNQSIPNSLYEMNNDYYIKLISNSFDKIYNNLPLTNIEDEIIFIFLNLCVNSKEENIPVNLFQIYDNYYKYLYEYGYYYNDKIENMFKDKITIEKNREKELKNEKNLTLKKDDRNFGFVDITLITCFIIIILIIILFILLVKK